MASINDLATAATIASSAVALQSSSPSQAASPLPPAPKTPLVSSASHTIPARIPPAETLKSPKLGQAKTPVLAALQTSPTDQMPPLGSGRTGSNGQAAGLGSASSACTMDEAKKPAVRGAFIVLEGLDRAGKTTQAKLLQQQLIEADKKVKHMRFPDRTTPIGQMIDSYLRGQSEIDDHVIHLLFTANRWEAAETIKQTLAEGITIVCDRYYHSGIVYSAAKQNPALSLGWAKAPEVGLPRPDMVLFLDLTEEVARQRGGWGGEVYEKGEMQRRVRELFWGLSMGDLGIETDGANKHAAAASRTASSATPRKPATMPVVHVDNNNGEKMGDTINVQMPGGRQVDVYTFIEEEEDINIIDADIDIEGLHHRIWEQVMPRLERVERGEFGDTVRFVKGGI